jgi:hypothetical protein
MKLLYKRKITNFLKFNQKKDAYTIYKMEKYFTIFIKQRHFSNIVVYFFYFRKNIILEKLNLLQGI